MFKPNQCYITEKCTRHFHTHYIVNKLPSKINPAFDSYNTVMNQTILEALQLPHGPLQIGTHLHLHSCTRKAVSPIHKREVVW